MKLGKPLELSSEQIEKLSQITYSDIEKAKLLWRDTVDYKYKTLLDAQIMDDLINDNSNIN